jgi:hypothetical protein
MSVVEHHPGAGGMIMHALFSAHSADRGDGRFRQRPMVANCAAGRRWVGEGSLRDGPGTCRLS